MGKLKEHAMTTLDISGLHTPHDLLKVDWKEYLVRWDDGQPRRFRVPWGRQHSKEYRRVMHEVKYRRQSTYASRGLVLQAMLADSRNLARIEKLSDNYLSPVMLVAYRGRLFIRPKADDQMTLPLQ